MPERTLRSNHGRGGAASRFRGRDSRRLRRSVSRGGARLPRAHAGRYRPHARVPALGVRHQAAGAGDDRQRPARRAGVRRSEAARRRLSPAAASTTGCWQTCRRASIRAARTASSTRSAAPGPCSSGRSRFVPAAPSSATDSSTAISSCDHRPAHADSVAASLGDRDRGRARLRRPARRYFPRVRLSRPDHASPARHAMRDPRRRPAERADRRVGARDARLERHALHPRRAAGARPAARRHSHAAAVRRMRGQLRFGRCLRALAGQPSAGRQPAALHAGRGPRRHRSCRRGAGDGGNSRGLDRRSFATA